MEKEQMRQFAKRMALENAESEPTLQKVLWFPHDTQLRLVEVVSDAIPSDFVVAFYFGPDAPGGIPVPVGLALILPGEYRKIPLPEDWGTWDDGEEIDIRRVREAG